MPENKNVLLPSPIIDAKEASSLKKLTERYDKLVQPGVISKIGNKAASLIPQPVKQEKWLRMQLLNRSCLFNV